VSVVIRRTDATLQVIVEDNGCGFDVGAQNAKPANTAASASTACASGLR